jgi:ATP-dependent RNA helicase RhlE
MSVLTELGYENPTPIQSKVIPLIKDSNDIVGIAQTGTGKTAAYLLPLIDLLREEDVLPKPKSCRALILVPTRELAAQVAQSVADYTKYCPIASAVIVGGVKHRPQYKAMTRGVDILIATPGRLEDLMSSGAVILGHTRVAVLDEADQMMDLGFMPAIRRILAKVPRKRQTLLFSATMPKQVRSLANDFLNDPVDVAVAAESKPIEKIEQRVYMISKTDKYDALVSFLSAPEVSRTIIFTRTKHGADRATKFLNQKGFGVAALHGNKSQSQRQKALGDFRDDKIQILVATDIAARGIDIDDISHVINYDVPNIPEIYVHRIGRTARAGRSGVAITLCADDEREHLGQIEKVTKQSFTRMRSANDETKPDGGWRPEIQSETDEVEFAHKPKSRGRRPQRGGGGRSNGGARSGGARSGGARSGGAAQGDASSRNRSDRPARADRRDGSSGEDGAKRDRSAGGNRTGSAKPAKSGKPSRRERSEAKNSERSDSGRPFKKPGDKPGGRSGAKPGAKPGAKSTARSGAAPAGKLKRTLGAFCNLMICGFALVNLAGVEFVCV